MNSNIQSSKTNPKTLTTLKNLCALFLFAGSMIAFNPAAAAGNNHSPAPDLFDDFGIQQTVKNTLPIKAVKGKNHSVNVNYDLLNLDRLTLNLFNDVVVTAVRDRIIDNVNGHTTWIGHVEGEQESEVFLTVHGKAMSGTVQIGANIYEIEPNDNGQHDIIQVDPSKNPGHSQPKQPGDLASGGQVSSTTTTAVTPATSAATTGPTIINLLAVYTPKSLSDATSLAGIETKITNAVAAANQAYINSNIPMQLNLVGMAQTQYAETGDMTVSLSRLVNTSDGYMDDVPPLRSQLGADQVVLVSADTNYCGYSYIMTSSWLSNNAFASYAYSVVHDDSVYACLAGSNTLAHELGHGQGNQHDIADASGPGAYSYSYGYQLCQTNGIRSIMAYACSGATMINYFSNPNIAFNGEVTGTQAANNALSMTNTASIVAAFMPAPATLPNAPGNLSASALSSSQITLTWSDNSSNETGFSLERSADGINWSQFAMVGSNVVNYTDTGLAASTTYNYRVSAYNSAGNSSYSNIGTATTGAAVIDTTAPVVSILNPANGSRVSGMVAVKVSASDNVSVSSLKLYIDGKLVSSSSASSLNYNWNTRKVSAGTHTISSQAADPSNNIGSQSVSVTK
ncbi:MAG: Ig-like domain-containing protein [Methylococcales bacterium]|nr:Ig-like domain-containing protein [Methylococcales bacterium]